MPELPEVETVVRGLRAKLAGARVASIALLRASVFRGRAAALGALEGARISAVRRGGKYIVFELTGVSGRRWQLMIHLGMTGKLLLTAADQSRARHTHLVFSFEGGTEMQFCDPRRFGGVALASAPAELGAFAPALGVAAGLEPLEATAEQVVELFIRRAGPLKNALLNQKLLRGLGNIYADESLFRAGIDPRATHVSRPRLRRLHAAIVAVLSEAIAAGGSSISDYVSAENERGWFQTRHQVYGRTGEPCVRCRKPIRRLVLAGRSAHFCPHCQKR